MNITCVRCNQLLNEDEVIKTDEIKEYGSEVKNYCAPCFLKYIKNAFNTITEEDNCSICKSPLVVENDDEELISLAKSDNIVHFVCEKIKNAREQGDEAEVERLEDEGHDWLGLYTIAVDPEGPDFG